jgi:MFS family permease
VALAEFVVVFDASIVNIALPSIGRALHFSLANLSWVVNAYVLTFGGFLLLGGRIADLLGRRRVFVVGLGVFSVASLASGLAQSEAWLIGARAGIRTIYTDDTAPLPTAEQSPSSRESQ